MHDECLMCLEVVGCSPQTLYPTAVGGKEGSTIMNLPAQEAGCLLLDDMSLGAIK